MKKIGLALMMAVVFCSFTLAPAFARDTDKNDRPYKNGEMKKGDEKRSNHGGYGDKDSDRQGRRGDKSDKKKPSGDREDKGSSKSGKGEHRPGKGDGDRTFGQDRNSGKQHNGKDRGNMDRGNNDRNDRDRGSSDRGDQRQTQRDHR